MSSGGSEDRGRSHLPLQLYRNRQERRELTDARRVTQRGGEGGLLWLEGGAIPEKKKEKKQALPLHLAEANVVG